MWHVVMPCGWGRGKWTDVRCDRMCGCAQTKSVHTACCRESHVTLYRGGGVSCHTTGGGVTCHTTGGSHTPQSTGGRELHTTLYRGGSHTPHSTGRVGESHATLYRRGGVTCHTLVSHQAVIPHYPTSDVCVPGRKNDKRMSKNVTFGCTPMTVTHYMSGRTQLVTVTCMHTAVVVHHSSPVALNLST